MVRIGEMFDVELTRIGLQKGDLCILQYPETVPTEKVEAWGVELRSWLNSHQHHDVMVLAIPRDCEMKTVPDSYLAKIGLQRIPTTAP